MNILKHITYGLLALTALCSCQGVENAKNNDAAAVERVIMSRRSIRQYTGQRISRDTLDKILQCGINAPNGRNRQAYEIRVVDDPALVNEISASVTNSKPEVLREGFSNIFAGATCVVFLAADTTYDMSQVDCGLLGENIMLFAWSMGIGSCCMAHPVREMKASEATLPYLKGMRFSENYELLVCIAMGYPDEVPEAKPRDAEKIKYVENTK